MTHLSLCFTISLIVGLIWNYREPDAIHVMNPSDLAIVDSKDMWNASRCPHAASSNHCITSTASPCIPNKTATTEATKTVAKNTMTKEESWSKMLDDCQVGREGLKDDYYKCLVVNLVNWWSTSGGRGWEKVDQNNSRATDNLKILIVVYYHWFCLIFVIMRRFDD